MPFYKDAESNFEYSHVDSHVVYERQLVDEDDNSSQSSNASSTDDGGEDVSSGWYNENAGNSDTGSGGSSNDGNGFKASKNNGVLLNSDNGRGKWFKKLRMIFDKLHIDEKKKKSTKVKSILRPPTEYAYVVGMSGLTSRVPVYKM
ncbi:uncharacterized protein LOC126904048 [Daktulosphaira vitifoliae]|uniref:uncharacterized protein LOC126904048 n=1 Tax=Daktulosphaira vitifoliae TaxID=58002 RepID=UPI0021AAE96E|nr:uncharacterized protein LOC126904048 [Daktulosphaira vitifoliae]